jgi:hypothetical protein
MICNTCIMVTQYTLGFWNHVQYPNMGHEKGTNILTKTINMHIGHKISVGLLGFYNPSKAQFERMYNCILGLYFQLIIMNQN